MKNLRKITCFAIMFTMLISIVPVNAKTIPAFSNEAYDEAYHEYKNDTQFKLMVREYGWEYGKKFLNNVIKRNIVPMLRSGGGGLCYQYVTNIMQTKDNNCGTTTVLQTLYGLNSAGAVAGASDEEKINTLDREYNVAAQGSLYVYQAVNALTKYSSMASNYTYREGSGISFAQFEDYVANSLTSCRPVILHARTKHLSYYSGKKLGHYLSLDVIDRNSHIVRIVDCNNDPNFYGEHYVNSKEAYNAINKEAGRYLIY